MNALPSFARRTATLFLLLGGVLLPALARPDAPLEDALTVDLSSLRIEITSKFNGTDLLLFGARNQPGDIVFAVRGPERSYGISRKERVAGLWVNQGTRRFRRISAYFMTGASDPEAFTRHADLLARLGVAPPLPPPESTASPLLPAHSPGYHAPLIRELNARELYRPHLLRAVFYGDSLFKASLPFSKNLPQGVYTAEVYLLSPSGLEAVQTIAFEARKEGLDAFLSDLAARAPAVYGALCVALALISGWAGGKFFRRAA